MREYTGKTFGSYRLHKLIGSGGYADVYEGVHTLLGTHVAIKVLKMRVDPQDIRAVRRSLKEALIANRLKHPHIIPILDCNIRRGIPYIVMPYVKQGSLQQIHGEDAQLSWDTIMDYVHQLAEILTFIHAHNLVHLDIKPANILLGDDGHLLLSDFGTVALIQHTGEHRPQERIGTIGYMAPDRFTDDLQTPASDVYSLGIVVYSWLTGRLPFIGSSSEVALKHLHASPPIQPLQASNIDPAIQHVLFRALEKDPRKRYQSAMEFYEALRDAKEEVDQHQLARRFSQRQQADLGRRTTRWQEMSGIIAIGMLLSILLATLLDICRVQFRTNLTVSLTFLSIFLIASALIRKNRLALRLIFTNYTVAIMIGIFARSVLSFYFALPIFLLISAYIGFFKGRCA